MTGDRELIERATAIVAAWRHLSLEQIVAIETEATQIEENASRVPGFTDLKQSAALRMDLCTLWRAILPEDLLAPDGASWRQRATELADVTMRNAQEISRVHARADRLEASPREEWVIEDVLNAPVDDDTFDLANILCRRFGWDPDGLYSINDGPLYSGWRFFAKRAAAMLSALPPPPEKD